MAIIVSKKEIQAELNKLIAEESAFDNDLKQYFTALAGGKSLPSSTKSFDSADLGNNIKKIEEFSPCFEAMIQDSKKLANQVEDCRALSDRLNIIVRRLDVMQIRAQQALACTEDVINLKDCKSKITAAMEAGNLPLAVSFIRQVHDVDLQAAKASDDYGSIQQAEKEVAIMVQNDFNKAIEESNINRVMSLCPLLQTLGLEEKARDTFIGFVEKTVFIAVSADASAVDDATDPATGYAQALSNVFNSTYMILQRYLPIVIQGMENSMGDVHFIRRLHAKCEKESGLVLKRYMKFRKIKDTIASMKAEKATAKSVILPSDIHMVLDELALLIQYCCMYSKYIKQLTDGAEKKKRSETVVLTENSVVDGLVRSSSEIQSQLIVALPVGASVPVLVFNGPTDFDKMVDELINRYYMEGEHWLMRSGVRSALPSNPSHTEREESKGSGLDECFFILQRCSQRAIATNNIHAACAVLHLISDMISSDLSKQAGDLLIGASAKAGVIMQEQMSKFTKGGGSDGTSSSASLAKGFQSAITLASSYTGQGGQGGKGDSAERGDEEEDRERDQDDPYGITSVLEVFNTMEMCVRYTERLSRDINQAGEAVFSTPLNSGDQLPSPPKGSNGSKLMAVSLSPEMEKLKICKEDFEVAQQCFQQLLRQGAERMVSVAQTIMKEVLTTLLGRLGPLGGVRFELEVSSFVNY